MINSNKLSKIISHALRHEPEKYCIVLDQDGWVDINSLLKGIQENVEEFKSIDLDDIFNAINSSKKRRHEIKEMRIRAIYGHSTEIEMNYIECIPPNILYHGTSKEASQLILSDGLRPMQRKYVHLSTNLHTAYEVGKRKEKNPIILSINAQKASSSGIVFYSANEDTLLAEYVPPKFIKKTEL